ncbi:Formylglycine-generating sulfatase enzyme [Rhodopirellula maiorica SM1]|uniref:Formylglycine-generating sulfatase enzyme n=1 Tax=Rhodopirellula maiorica SM1 TaxID=1265738 RepID=M5RGZ2_9BACT|nr:Formylglycine-generating sulfatase enzyme [Rhodopirellula maiorica SM1]
MVDCGSFLGKLVELGHRDTADNPPKKHILKRQFQLCRYPVTKRLYDLFDSFHCKSFDDTSHSSLDSRRPVIDITWHDAMMFAIGSGSTLLTEWEWEYSCREVGACLCDAIYLPTNIWEWQRNTYGSQTNSRSCRFGFAISNSLKERFSCREQFDPSYTDHTLGFRIARNSSESL